MFLSIKKSLLASLLIQQTFGFWTVNIDKRPSNAYGSFWISPSYFEIPNLYNYERKDSTWKSSCGGCGRGNLIRVNVNTPEEQCNRGCDIGHTEPKMTFKTVDSNNYVLAKLDYSNGIYRSCGMVYDNFNFTTYACGPDVNEQLAKLSTLNLKDDAATAEKLGSVSTFWTVTVDKDIEYGYKNELTVDYFNYNNGSIESHHNSRCLSTIDLPNDNYFTDDHTIELTCDNINDPLSLTGVGNVLKSLDNKVTKETYPCFLVEHKLRFTVYACGKHVPVPSAIIPPSPTTTTTTITTTTTTTTTKSSSTSVPTCTMGYCGKKAGTGPNGACCSSSDDCLDTCNSNGKCGVSDMTGEPKTGCPAVTTTIKPTSTVAPTCTKGYCGKKAGTGPNGACCSSSDDCLDTCNSNGKCGVSDMTGEPKTGCLA